MRYNVSKIMNNVRKTTVGGYIQQMLKSRVLLNVLLVHPKGMNDKTLDEKAVKVSALVNSALMLKKDRRVAVITTAKSDYLAKCVNNAVDAWIAGLTPRYHCYILTSTLMGKASTDIIALALKEGKPVRLLTPTGLLKVVNIHVINSRDWQTGWEVVTAN